MTKKNGHFDTTNNCNPSPSDSTAIFIFFCHFLIPSYNSTSFRNFLAVLLPPPYTKLKL